MDYSAELNFFKSILLNLHLKATVLQEDEESEESLDFGIRSLLHLKKEYESMFSVSQIDINPNTIIEYTDEFRCKYIYMLLPDTDKKTVLLIGPYTETVITKEVLAGAEKEFGLSNNIILQIEKYYTKVPYFENTRIITTLVNSFAQTIWGGFENYSLEYKSDLSFHDDNFSNIDYSVKKGEDAELAIQILESRYQKENELMIAVSQGLLHKAEQMLGNAFRNPVIEKRAEDPVRDLKNYIVILNTLLRKAAENGAVHPLYIDRMSSAFAIQAEALTNLDDGYKLIKDMGRSYCRLVQKHSVKSYSPLVRKAVIRIDADLTADLSLNKQAQLLNVNPSYLSALFKKETGITLTDYVNTKRVEHAALLLRKTDLQIQTVAQKCGIYDVNYFTKLFKKYENKTPKEYREANSIMSTKHFEMQNEEQ